MDHPGVTESEIFEELPEVLQTEVEGLVTWHNLENPRNSSSVAAAAAAALMRRNSQSSDSSGDSEVDLMRELDINDSAVSIL